MDQALDTNSFDVKALRDRIGWTQEQVATYLGVNRSVISRLEAGQPISGPVRRLLAILSAAADKGIADTLLAVRVAEAPESLVTGTLAGAERSEGEAAA
ncbi:DNA-binding transcriptional regulator [Mesorhizobium sp.]|uniref:helix-turn-helix domain-containing protein n=1 Tax=Mesorhizobium sp. TaxID=1871066 RepID=UPI000FEA776F|nr:helix-turn-helix transcriptional regulator [Mesorhizobium sp.]RWF66874.1 MAG: helix-turn-helix domain-containing protein [Mesorhizobium sp.]